MAKQPTKFNGEILHTAAVRYRITGSGALLTSLHSLDDINNSDLSDLTMAVATNKEPILLANFREQRIQLELGTEEIDEYFIISKIVIFVKPVAEGYPVGV